MGNAKKKRFNYYEQWEHNLQTEMLRASTLPTAETKKQFITATFIRLNLAYEEKAMNKTSYLRLVNRLAAFDGGTYNDYLDLLVGSASMGMLDTLLEEGTQRDLAKLARSRSGDVTRLTGMSPITPEED
jgi:hypothetical protein